jgi:hypothetical protein
MDCLDVAVKAKKKECCKLPEFYFCSCLDNHDEPVEGARLFGVEYTDEGKQLSGVSECKYSSEELEQFFIEDCRESADERLDPYA